MPSPDVDRDAAVVQMQAQAQAQAQDFRLALDLIPGLVWTGLPDGYIDFLNQRWCEYTGMPLDIAGGWGWMAAIHPDDLSGLMEIWRELLASGSAGGAEARLRRNDGVYRWFLFRSVPLHDAQGRLLKWYGQTTDIEDRKRAETLLADEKALLESIATGSPLPQVLELLCRLVERNARDSLCAIVMVDASGSRLEHGAGPSLPQLFNEGIHGRLVNRDSGPCGMAAFLNEQVITADIESETRWRESAWCLHALNHGLRACWSTPIVSSAGKVLGTFAIYFPEPREPTALHFNLIDRFTHLASLAIERVTAERALQRSEVRLRQAQRLEAMGTLAGGIAHDFNNILGAILGYGEMALREVSEGTRLQRDLNSILVAGERGRALVDRILLFSRSGVAERVAVHVEQVVGEAMELVAATLPDGIRIASSLRAGRAALLGDPTQVHQLLMNLATNAVHAMPVGGTLAVTLERLQLVAALEVSTGTVGEGDYIVLTVADTGTGMSKAVLERIFDPFFTTKEVGVGTGLGLSLVHGIVGEVGGAVDVRTAPGAGSTFTVYLPCAGDAHDAADPEVAALPIGQRQRVLVVDDEEALVRLVSDSLTGLGYEAVGFTSSAAALEAVRADPARFDALLTDERMPGLSGSALICAVRSIRGQLPALLVSGYVGADLLARAREAGAADVLKKPLLLRELAAGMARALSANASDAAV